MFDEGLENVLEDYSLVRTREQEVAFLHLLSLVLQDLTYTQEDLSGNSLPDYSTNIDDTVVSTTEEIIEYMVYPKIKKAFPKKLRVKKRIKSVLEKPF